MPRPARRRPAPRVAFAVAAHPDDIEFLMAGTLLLLKEAGWATHYMTVADGCCGSLTEGPAATRRRRRREARTAAALLGARFHESLTGDLTIVYSVSLLRRLTAVVRGVAPDVLLVPSPQDYMEDHTATCRLAVTAAFARGVRNFRTVPPARPVDREVVIYHAMPHGLDDPLRRRVVPDLYVDTSTVHAVKRAALEAHVSQQAFLAATQHMGSHADTMDWMSREVGRMSGRFAHAEGWRRHLHLGFGPPDADPLREVLGPRCVVRAPTNA